MPNRLAAESSPYLQRHARNPVDWYPWGEEALARARREHKPIFLSIGYSACHWCHVMEKESFANAETAALMNALFVNVKVDREERPDLDAIYMRAVVAMTGRGGWPMSVWLTPEGVPFFGGTYFPDRPRAGMPSFRQVLQAVADAWAARSQDIAASAADTLAYLTQETRAEESAGGTVDPDLPAKAVRQAAATFDWENGGWGNAPKFPQAMLVEFLLRHHVRTGDTTSLRLARATLEAMARGGIYDQLGGGFHRYAVDAAWVVPHFEKMLYDNAQLARVYLHAWQLTGEALFRRVAVETLDYLLREMLHQRGGFFGSQDADSAGEEGRFYVWTPAEVGAVLAPDTPLARRVMATFGVNEGGNFAGKSVLHLARDPIRERSAGPPGTRHPGGRPPDAGPPDAWPPDLAAARRRLLAAREKRAKPARDEKVIAAWNGLTLAAFAEAARAFERADYATVAIRTATFLLAEMRTPEGRLYRSWKDGDARLPGYLEDYTHVAEGLLCLYELTFAARWFEHARALMETVLARFSAPGGGFHDTAADHEELVVRPRDVQDNAVPSGNAMAAAVLVRLAALSGEPRYAKSAEDTLSTMGDLPARYPTAYGQWLVALESAVGPRREVAVVGPTDAPQTRALLAAACAGYRPFQVTAFRQPGEPTPVGILAGRQPPPGEAAAWVCADRTCLPPITDAEALRQALE